MSGDWRGTLWTLLVTFFIVIIGCTETFWSPCITSGTARGQRTINWETLSGVRVSVACCSTTFATMLGQSSVKNSAHFLRHRFQKTFVLYSEIIFKYLNCHPPPKYTLWRLCDTFLTLDHPNCVRRRVQLIQGVFFLLDRKTLPKAPFNALPALRRTPHAGED